jgi:hypothetical protein
LSWLKYESSPAVKRACNTELFVLSFQQLAGEPIEKVMQTHPGQAAADILRRLACFQRIITLAQENDEISG